MRGLLALCPSVPGVCMCRAPLGLWVGSLTRVLSQSTVELKTHARPSHGIAPAFPSIHVALVVPLPQLPGMLGYQCVKSEYLSVVLGVV